MKKKILISLLGLSAFLLSAGGVYATFQYSQATPHEINTPIEKTINAFNYDVIYPEGFDEGYQTTDDQVTSTENGGLNDTTSKSGFYYGAIDGGFLGARTERGYFGSMDPWISDSYGISDEYAFIMTTQGKIPNNEEKGWYDPIYMYVTLKSNLTNKKTGATISPVYRIIYAKDSEGGEYKAVEYKKGKATVTKYETTSFFNTYYGFAYTSEGENWQED